MFNHPKFQSLLKSKPKFDLGIMTPENMDVGLYCLIKYWGNPPFIFYYSGVRMPPLDLLIGNPMNTATYAPVPIFDYPQEMSFMQRVTGVFFTYFMAYGWGLILLDIVAADTKEILNLDTVPDMWGMAEGASLVFNNALPLLDGVRPLNPNTIQVGGIHAAPPKPLTGDLKKWVEEAQDGVIYVSFGSVSIVITLLRLGC